MSVKREDRRSRLGTQGKVEQKSSAKSEDTFIRKEMHKPDSTMESVKYGAISARNTTVLQWNDLVNRMHKDEIAGEQARQRFGTKLNTKMIEEKQEDIARRQEVMNVYREKELENRKEFELFYNSLGENTFQKISSQLTYGASSNLLNPIEFTKNMAINTTINLLVPGSGAVAMSARFGANMFADTIDNYLSNSWEDELLGLTREPNEKLVQALGGAIVSNVAFPMIKYGGKKAVGYLTDGMVLKGKTIRADILDPEVTKAHAKALGEVTAVDTSHRDFRIADSVKKEYIKNQDIEEGLERVFTKQEIKNNIIRETTGYEAGVVDYKAGREQLLSSADRILQAGKKKASKVRSKGKDISLREAEDKSNAAIGKMAEDWANQYIVAPYTITKEGYKVQSMKTLRELHPMFSDTIGMSMSGKGYNDLLGNALEDRNVAKSILPRTDVGILSYAPKDADGWNITSLKNYGYAKHKNFRQSIENGVTYNVRENEILLKSSPKYYRYFSDTDDPKIFDDQLSNIFKEYKERKLNFEELAMILEAKRSRYETKEIQFIDVREEGTAQIKYRDVLKDKAQYVGLKNFNIDKLTDKIENIKQKKVDTAILKLSLDKQRLLGDLEIKSADEFRSIFGENIYSLKRVAEGEEFESIQKDLFHKLTETTKDYNKIKEDIHLLETGERSYEDYDLMKFIHETFVGDTAEERINNYMDFVEPYLRENYDMLNVMDKLIMNEQAAISTWGIPFKVLEDLVQEKGSLLNFFNQIPILRKNIAEGIDINEELANNHGYKTLSPIIMEKIENFIDKETLFPRDTQKKPFEPYVNAALGIVRGSLLFWSGKTHFLRLVS